MNVARVIRDAIARGSALVRRTLPGAVLRRPGFVSHAESSYTVLSQLDSTVTELDRNAETHDFTMSGRARLVTVAHRCRLPFVFSLAASAAPNPDMISHTTRQRYPARHGDHPTTGLPYSSRLTFGPPFTLTAKISGSPLRRSSSKDTCRQRNPRGTAPCRCATDRCRLRRCKATGAGGVGRAPPRLRRGMPCAR